MANPRVFISFDYDNDSGSKLYFVGQAVNPKTPFNIKDWSSKAHLPQREWEELIEAKIKKCNMVIVLVGKSMSSASGVAKEINFAKNNNVPLFGVYVNGAGNTTTLPGGLQRNRVISWTWDGVYSAINQMMTEGKNV